MHTDTASGARCFQTMVPMRDGVRLNTFVFLPASGGPRYPVILHRTPYGITSADAPEPVTDCTRAWLPSADGADARLDPARLAQTSSRTAMPRSTRTRAAATAPKARTASMPTTPRTATTRSTGSPTSPGATGWSACPARRPAPRRRLPRPRSAIRACARSSRRSAAPASTTTWSTKGQSIEMERLWLWVAKNIPGLSRIAPRGGHAALRHRRRGTGRGADRGRGALYTPRRRAPAPTRPSSSSADWMRLPLTRLPGFRDLAAFLDEIISHPAPDAFRARHNFRRTIEIPGFHVTTWFDIFQTSVIAAFSDIQARIGNQKLWIGPNEHYFVYAGQFLAARSVFRVVRLLAEGRADRHHGRAGGVLFAARLGRGSRRLCGATTGAMPSAGRRPGTAAAALSARRRQPRPRRGRAARRAAIATIRAGRSRRSAGATC